MTGQNLSSEQQPTGPPADDATRHLAAAAHVHDEFADEIIEEFLVERRRAIPPSPGVDPVVVLAEAIAATRRRVIRDSIVLALFVIILIAGWPDSLAWPIAALGGLFTRELVTARSRNRSTPTQHTIGGWLAFLVGATIAWVIGWYVVGFVFNSTITNSAGEVTLAPSGASGVGLAISLVFGVALIITTVADRMQVHVLLRQRFRRSAWLHQNGWVRGYPVARPPASAWYAARLKQIATNAGTSNTHVHHGYKAFVGAGERTHGWNVVTRLCPGDEDIPVRQVTPSVLYQAVLDEVLAMRDSIGLAPGERLGTLQHQLEVITSARALLYYNEDPLASTILPNYELPPRTQVEPELITAMLDRPPEWIRPYLSFRIEGWYKELVVSTYLHIGCDNEMLYLEWAGYQLNPVKPEFQVERMELNDPATAALAGVMDGLTVPISLFRRLRTLVRAMKYAGGPKTAPDLDDPASSYGAKRSIREIAADSNTSSYFERMDAIRYLRLLEHRTLTAVTNTLVEHGLSTTELAQQSRTIINSTVISGGTVTAGNIGGAGNQVQAEDIKASPVDPQPAVDK